jgi:site-specific DNA-methyltransferase (adenine-specific)
MSVLRRLIAVYTRPGDLVVDPFCGHGTVVLAAVEQGRSGIGYDIDADCVAAAVERLERATRARRGRRGVGVDGATDD